jgi:C-terminal processing protease CtpA/Prc
MAPPRLLIGIALSATLLGGSGKLVAGDPKACTVKAHECEQFIRDAMYGKKYLGAKFGDSRWGLTVKEIISGSPAERGGLKVGDRIVAVNGVDCSKADMPRFKRVLGKAKDTGKLTIAVQRLGAVSWVTVELRPMSNEQISRAVASHIREAHMSSNGDRR